MRNWPVESTDTVVCAGLRYFSLRARSQFAQTPRLRQRLRARAGCAVARATGGLLRPRRASHRRSDGHRDAGHSGQRADRGRRQHALPQMGRRQKGQGRRDHAAGRDQGSSRPHRSRLRARADSARWLRGERSARGSAAAAARGVWPGDVCGRRGDGHAHRRRKRRYARFQPASPPPGGRPAPAHSLSANRNWHHYPAAACSSGRGRRRFVGRTVSR